MALYIVRICFAVIVIDDIALWRNIRLKAKLEFDVIVNCKIIFREV